MTPGCRPHTEGQAAQWKWVVMNLGQHPGLSTASRLVGLAALIVGITVVLAHPTGSGPAGAAPASNWTLYVVSPTSTSGQPPVVTPVDTATNTAGTKIPFAADSTIPESIAITPDGTTAYVTDPLDKTVIPIDLATNIAETPIPVAGYTVAIAVTPNGATAYVTDADGVTPINTATNTAGTPIPISGGAAGIAITPNGTTAYVGVDGGLVPIDLATNTPGTMISDPDLSVGPYATQAIAITPDGDTAYVSTGGPCDCMTPINLATNTIGTPITLQGSQIPSGIAITPNGSTAYVTQGSFGFVDDAEGIVTPIDLATSTAGTPIPIAGLPEGIAITPNGSTAYAATYGCVPATPPIANSCGNAPDNLVTPIDIATNTAGTPITVPNQPTCRGDHTRPGPGGPPLGHPGRGRSANRF